MTAEENATTIFLARIGESQASSEGKVAGRKDRSHLSELGRVQVHLLRDRFVRSGLLFKRVYCSTHPSAVQSARILSTDETPELVQCPHFDGPDIGEWAGLTRKEIKKRWPRQYSDFFISPPSNAGGLHILPGGETWNQMSERAFHKLREVANQSCGDRILVVTHGHILKVLICAILQLDFSRLWLFPQNNASLMTLRFDGSRFVILRHGDVSHLEERGIPTAVVGEKATRLPGVVEPDHHICFISCSKKDWHLSTVLSSGLKEAGIDTFLFHEDIEPGMLFPGEIVDALNRCDVFLPMLTRAYSGSRWCMYESDFALSLSLAEKSSLRIVPLRFEGAVSDYPRFRPFTHVKCTRTRISDASLGRLVRIVRSRRRRTTVVPLSRKFPQLA